MPARGPTLYDRCLSSPQTSRGKTLLCTFYAINEEYRKIQCLTYSYNYSLEARNHRHLCIILNFNGSILSCVLKRVKNFVDEGLGAGRRDGSHIYWPSIHKYGVFFEECEV